MLGRVTAENVMDPFFRDSMLV